MIATHDSVIVWHSPLHRRLRLVCFPYAGGTASAFRTWTSTLPHDVELCAIELPGREGRFRECAVRDLRQVVAMLASDWERYGYSEPSVFFGHSMGALLAFELTRELRRRKIPTPIHLAVAGHGAPQAPKLGRLLSDLPEDQLLEEIRQLGGTPDHALRDRELLTVLLPTLRADLAICDTYEYVNDDALPCSVSVYVGRADPRVTPRSTIAWEAQTRGSFRIVVLPGGHFFINDSRDLFLAALARELESLIEPATPQPTPGGRE